MPQPILILFGALFTATVSVLLGKLLLRMLRLSLYRLEEEAFAFVAGSAVLSGVIFFLESLKLARKGVFIAIGLVAIGVSVRRGAHRIAEDRLPGIPRLYAILMWIAIAIFGAVYLANSMAPERSPDGATYHLGLVGRLDRAHGFDRNTSSLYANLSLGIELLFHFAYSIGRHSAAATLHLCFLLALLAMMVCYGRRFGFAAAGVTGGLFVFMSPVVGVDAASAYNDVALAAVLFAVFYALQIWDADLRPGWLIAIGMLAGFAYAVKYTGFLAVPYAAGFIVWRLWRRRVPFVRPAAIFVACSLIPILPWVAKNWILTGNPLSPFFNQVFPNPFVHISWEKEFSAWMRHYDMKSLWDIPLEVTLGGLQLGGLIGPLFLLLPLSLLSLRDVAGRRLLFAALVFALTYPANIGARFLIPPLPFLALPLAFGLAQANGLAPLLILAHGVLGYPNVINEYARNAWHLDSAPFDAALRIVSEEEFLAERLGGYLTARLVDEKTPDGARVFSFSPLPEAYTSQDILVSFQSAPNQAIRDILHAPLIPDQPPLNRFDLRFPRLNALGIRVRQTTPAGTDLWSITELRIFADGKEAPRSGWHAHSRPNPWDVQLAIDGNPSTRWRSWQAIDAKMYFEIELREAVEIDMVRVESSSDQYQTSMALDVFSTPRGWITVGSFPDRAIVPAPAGLRSAATMAVKARGIDYLVVNDYDFAANDMKERTSEWNLSLVGERAGARLYRIR